VLASQFAWADQFRVQMEYLAATHGDPARMVYAIAGAPYFDLRAADQRTDLTSGEVLDALEASAGALASSRSFERMAATTAWWGLRPFMGYEAGPDTAGPNNLAAKREASYSPRMRRVCADFLRTWAQNGGGLTCWYVSGAGDWMSRSGSWPVTETMADQATPKLQALDDFASLGEVPLRIGQEAPGLLDARRHVARRDDWESFPGTGIIAAGGRFDYLVRAPRGGRMRFRVLASCWIPGAALAVEVNRRGFGAVLLPVTGGWRNPNTAWSDPVEVELPAGLSTVRLTTNVAYGHDLLQLMLTCRADLNADGFLDFFDYDTMVACFEGEQCPPGVGADFNEDGFVDFFDYDAFNTAFEAGC
jgi:hypothetical protein